MSNERIGFRYEDAGCDLVVTPATVHLINLYSATLRQGYGTKVMELACAWADANGRTMRLTADGYSATAGRPLMSPEQLVKFYEKFGFVQDSSWADKFPPRMIRVVR